LEHRRRIYNKCYLKLMNEWSRCIQIETKLIRGIVCSRNMNKLNKEQNMIEHLNSIIIVFIQYYSHLSCVMILDSYFQCLHNLPVFLEYFYLDFQTSMLKFEEDIGPVMGPCPNIVSHGRDPWIPALT
jgi:hypothetical protein